MYLGQMSLLKKLKKMEGHFEQQSKEDHLLQCCSIPSNLYRSLLAFLDVSEHSNQDLNNYWPKSVSN